MTTTLDNTLLVLLSMRSGTAHELQQRHATVFGEEHHVDLLRILATATRLERSGHISVWAPKPKLYVKKNRQVYSLTPAGRLRQRQWLVGVTAATSADDVYLRGLLAVEAADQETFALYLANSLATVRHQHRAAVAAAGDSPAERARTAFELEQNRALTLWLHGLAEHRDHTALPG